MVIFGEILPLASIVVGDVDMTVEELRCDDDVAESL
jgi:hypothetical protein